jgi:hypothetical protein
MSFHRKFSPGFSRAVNHLLRSLPGIRHATAADPDAATTMEKLDAALNNMSHGLCMFGPDNLNPPCGANRCPPPDQVGGHASLENAPDRLRRTRASGPAVRSASVHRLFGL